MLIGRSFEDAKKTEEEEEESCLRVESWQPAVYRVKLAWPPLKKMRGNLRTQGRKFRYWQREREFLYRE